jgi:hypothetical protein
MRFEIEVELEAQTYGYSIAFEFPEGFKELRVLEEKLTVGGKPVYSREVAQVHVAKMGQEKEASFLIDWHLVALPIIQQQSKHDPLIVFKQWLARMLILRPVPSLILGDSKEETLEPNLPVTDFGAWFSGQRRSCRRAGSRRRGAMSVNRRQPRIFVLPEDRANSQVANGFLLDRHLSNRQSRSRRLRSNWFRVGAGLPRGDQQDLGAPPPPAQLKRA